MTASVSPENPTAYRGLPALAGLATVEEAARPGMGIEACVARLKRFHYAFSRLHAIFNARITAEPVYELKCGFAHHAYLCAEHVSAIRQRVGEMREPPLGLDVVPDPAFEVYFDEILAAPTTEELLVGLYEQALPALDTALENYRAGTNPLADAPSVRLIRFARLELADMIEFGRACATRIVDMARRSAMTPWIETLERSCGRPGGWMGAPPGPIDAQGRSIQRLHSSRPYVYDPVPKRDDRFRDLFNQGVNAESFLYNPEFPPRAKSLMMLFKRHPRDRRAGDDGQHHSRDEGKAVGLLPRHVATALGRGAARDDGGRGLRGPGG